MADETVSRADDAPIPRSDESSQATPGGHASGADVLPALRQLLNNISSELDAARQVLCDSGENASVHVVASVLGKLGWMADYGAALAGELPPKGGDLAHEWLLSPRMRELMQPSP